MDLANQMAHSRIKCSLVYEQRVLHFVFLAIYLFIDGSRSLLEPLRTFGAMMDIPELCSEAVFVGAAIGDLVLLWTFMHPPDQSDP